MIIDKYLELGLHLTPQNIHGLPFKEWTTKKYSREELLKYNSFAWVIGDEYLVIDIDPRNGGDQSFDQLLSKYNFHANVISPRGGRHFYFKKDKNVRFIRNLNLYKGIDFLSGKNKVTIPPSVASLKQRENGFTSDYKLVSMEFNVLPLELIKIIEREPARQLSHSLNNGEDENGVRSLLSFINPNCDYSEWIKIGMSLYSWDNNAGLPLFEEWSKGSSSYTDDCCSARWESFSDNSFSLGTLKFKAKEEAEKLILSATKDNIEDISLRIRNASWGVLQREDLTTILSKKLKEFGLSKTISKTLMKKDSSSYHIDAFDSWVYIRSTERFFNVHTFEEVKEGAFNMIMGSHVPEGKNGSRVSATKYLSSNGVLKTVYDKMYMPHIDSDFYTMNGRNYINSFNKNLLPKPCEYYTDENMYAIERMKKHLLYIFNYEDRVDLILNWVAHNVQCKGKKVRFTPFIQSFEGVGKSYVGRLMRTILGGQNVKVVSSSQLTSDFDDWASESCVTVLEEIRISGHNRYEIMDKLKQKLSDDDLPINQKFKDSYQIVNTVNYLAFSNHKDALTLSENDRRWWVTFCNFGSIKQFEDTIGFDSNEYYIQLEKDLANHGSAFVKYFSEYEIDKEFYKITRAPNTLEKEMMVCTEKSMLEGVQELNDILESGGYGFGTEVFCASLLTNELKLSTLDIFKRTDRYNRLFKQAGFMLHPKTVRWNNSTYKVWCRRSLTTKQIAELLDKTLEKTNELF